MKTMPNSSEWLAPPSTSFSETFVAMFLRSAFLAHAVDCYNPGCAEHKRAGFANCPTGRHPQTGTVSPAGNVEVSTHTKTPYSSFWDFFLQIRQTWLRCLSKPLQFFEAELVDLK
jgi:hypothetical protein